MKNNGLNTDILDGLIVGRVEPHIYAFSTQTVPNYLKVGDTYRPVATRLNEWRSVYPNLEHVYTESARINEDTIFRDYSVHEYLEKMKHFHRLTPSDMPTIPYYSKEFFKDATSSDIDEAIADIKHDAESNSGKYTFYTTSHLPKRFQYARGESLEPRENQKEVIENFKTAIKRGRSNLLMYAVMRFGKSFTSMCCAKAMDAKLTLVVSAKADVKDEWKKTVESIGNFEGFSFADKTDLLNNKSYLRESKREGKHIVLFLTLQDLQGSELKTAHREVFAVNWDLLLVDETHFGARAEHYGAFLKSKKEAKLQMEDVDTLDKLDEVVKELHNRITIHLSGTPYRILMGSEFEKEDIIAFVQFSDIAAAQAKWENEHKLDEESSEWENPYFGFPQMIRFAFRPNQASLDRIESLRAGGATISFSELFRPMSLQESDELHKRFAHQDVVLDLLQVIDGTKEDVNVLGFLDNERIKEGKLCRHIVFVLPYCASCDAMQELLESHKEYFKHLAEYEIINISGLTSSKEYKDTAEVKRHIAECESSGKKTITLTVNRMLTGNTVPQWDTMLFFKQTSSPEEYDQATFRLQNPFIDEYVTENGNRIKLNLKPQTILVDFDPDRMMRLQERKSQIYNVNTDNNGNLRLKERIEAELRISPIIILDHNKLREVTSSNILDAVRDYAQTRSVVDEASDMPFDISLLENMDILSVIETLSPIDSKKGLTIPTFRDKDSDGDNIDTKISDTTDNYPPLPTSDSANGREEKEKINNKNVLAKKFAAYYALILFFSFLTNDDVKSLEEIIEVLDKSPDNIRISRHLGLSKKLLQEIYTHSNGFVLSKLDYKIHNTNNLNHDLHKSVLERVNTALTKFGRMSSSEIVVPPNIADRMAALLPESFATSNDLILDIASKQGEFTLALIRRFGKNIGNRIFAVCTSGLAYEFTRKVYSLLSLPTSNIYSDFTSIDLIKPNNEYTPTLKKMKFSAIIGNPPYQEDNKGNGNGSNPLYHLFIDLGRELSKFSTLIHPARFLFNVGKTPKDWNHKILNASDFKVVDYWADSSGIFPDVEVKGGVAVTLSDKSEDFGKIGVYYPFPEMRSIIDKVKGTCDKEKETRDKENGTHGESLSDIIYPRDLYRLTEVAYKENPSLENRQSMGHRLDIGSSVFDVLPEIFLSDKPESGDYIGIYGLQKRVRVTKWMKREYVKTPDNIDSYKVLIPKSNGSGTLGETLSTPVVGAPTIGHTLTFLSIGKFEEESQAEACLKYIKTRFARVLLGSLKVTQDNPRDTWTNVPMQDFTSNSDIDWSVGVTDIDHQLYAKYDLTPEEISFIESMIKGM